MLGAGLFSGLYLQDSLLAALDISIVAYLLYRVLLVIKDTRAFQILIGLLLVAMIYMVSHVFKLYTLNWILKQFFNPFILIIIILFQDDIRRGLARVGKNPFFSGLKRAAEAEFLGELVNASESLAKKKIGGLIVVERETKLAEWNESGIELDAKVSKEVLTSIFLPTSPIHDGAVVIHEGRLVSAGVILPLTQDPRVSKALGTRHRAAIGITEISDALVIVVSEEDGSINLVLAGQIEKDLEPAQLRKRLGEVYRTALEDLSTSQASRPIPPAVVQTEIAEIREEEILSEEDEAVKSAAVESAGGSTTASSRVESGV